MPKKAILLIPLTYNDGSAVPGEILDDIFELLFLLGGGLTSAGTVRGAYRMKDGSRQTDCLEQVWLVYEDAQEPKLRELVAQIGATLRQETMYLEISDSTIEFVPSNEEV